MYRKIFLLLAFLSLVNESWSQAIFVKGKVTDQASGESLPLATISIPGTNIAAQSDMHGNFVLNIPDSSTERNIVVSYTGYQNDTVVIKLQTNIAIKLKPMRNLDEVVVTGTLKAMSRMESPIPVEVYTPKYFKKNPTPSLFDAVGMINGVRPQLNCNVCNTGDIHINGMEGPYTLILIDGMPLVSALSTVYGLSGIPNSIVERLEVVKGPAASLYGSEAMGGIINVITKSPARAARLSADIMGTSWGEYNADLSLKARIGDNIQSLLGINYFNYQNIIDKNKDGFTDVTLQNRISIFNKWDFKRKENRIASLAARYVYEDRWGGQTNWNKNWRGSDSIYGESIYTNRWEIIGQYQLPTREKLITQFSVIGHNQNSYYGTTSYQANQKVAFAQLYWDKQIGQHSLLSGASYRYTYYNDNTPGTATEDGYDKAVNTPLPGIFVQDEWSFSPKQKLLLGYRYDYDRIHHSIHSPRIAYKFSPNNRNTLRASFGTGFRVVNLFTEDHAALTGSRKVEIAEALKPEKSLNSNLNYVRTITLGSNFLNIDATAFYSYFSNKILGDYNIDPNKIIYSNLAGHAVSQGISVNTNFTFSIPLSIMAGVTYMDVYQMKEDPSTGGLVRSNQFFAPKWSGNFSISYSFPSRFTIDVTGQVNGPMRLPLQKDDYRPEYSPAFCLANIQVTKKVGNRFEFYGGVKNIFNFVPKETFMRPFDPFDKYVNDPVTNPKGYTFDTEYNYAPLQGTKAFAGIRYVIQ
ncbi:MAG: TonB-dependent receptor [Taibaiella sp.]|jgi:outer membrane receptor for ferrienterochelin and colicins